MKNVYFDLRKHARKIMNYEKKRNDTIKNRGNKIHLRQQISYMQKTLSTAGDNRKYHKVRDHFHYTEKYREAAHNIFNLRYKNTKKNSHIIS